MDRQTFVPLTLTDHASVMPVSQLTFHPVHSVGIDQILAGAITMPDKEEQQLNRIRAVWNAFFSVDVSHYPRFIIDGKEQKVEESVLIAKIGSELTSLSFDEGTLQDNLKQARESLDEVKALTEYEDQKATRVLTIVTIFVALAGLIFTRLADLYPFRAIIGEYGLLSLQAGLVIANYFLFLGFILFAISGALVIFHATRIRFKYPMLGPGDRSPSTKSFLFYKEIIQVTPENWARSFLSNGPNGKSSEIRKDLAVRYFRNHIIESYLIAAKVADKLRYLMPAQDILSVSIRILLIWLFVGAVTFAVVPEQPKLGMNPIPSAAIGQQPPALSAPTPSSATTTSQPQARSAPVSSPATIGPEPQAPKVPVPSQK